MEIRGSAALVTGAGRGLGAELARALAAEGARVVLVARTKGEVEAVAREIGGHAIVEDVGDKTAIHRIAGAAAALVGPIDLLVNNASTLGPVPLRPLLDTDCEDVERALAVNLVGPFRLTKVVASAMALRGRGLVVNVTSDASVAAYAGWGAYSVSKAALDHLTRILAVELAGTGVRAVSVDPGEMDTRMHAEAMPDSDRSSLAPPREVAARVVRLVRAIEAIENGARVEAARFAAEGRP